MWSVVHGIQAAPIFLVFYMMTDRKCSRKFHFLNVTGFFTETSKRLLYVAVRLWKSFTNEFTLFGPDKLHCDWVENC